MPKAGLCSWGVLVTTPVFLGRDFALEAESVCEQNFKFSLLYLQTIVN
jgi:hypothetical protein